MTLLLAALKIVLFLPRINAFTTVSGVGRIKLGTQTSVLRLVVVSLWVQSA